MWCGYKAAPNFFKEQWINYDSLYEIEGRAI